MEPIGGYFEWEFPERRKFALHEGAVFLNSGRHSLEYILQGLGNVSMLWVPYFTCDAVFMPLNRLGIPYKFYHVNELLELGESIELLQNEYLLYTNYFGVKDEYVCRLSSIYGERLIVDNAQAFFCPAQSGSHQIYSPRKYMGMPDGGIAVTTVAAYDDSLELDVSFGRCAHLLKRLDMAPSDGYNDFKLASKSIAESPLRQMSILSKKILCSVDLKSVVNHRRENFEYLHSCLGESNRLEIPLVSSFACPMVYPYWTDDDNLRKRLIANSIFVATYWPNVLESCAENSLEFELAKHVIPIPCDQRYDIADMKRILEVVGFPKIVNF
ncbi:hypothetical protein [Fibrobacter sp.]|uniref:hypothetical protein n=1 Tax=Fibrobacter sp. TaxID=35828 RepID=UPI00388F60BE